jgi:hypothetical protein
MFWRVVMWPNPRVAIADVRKRGQLLRRQQALRHLDAHHRRVLELPLTVGATHEAKHPPLIRRDLASLELVQGGRKFVDVRFTRK